MDFHKASDIQIRCVIAKAGVDTLIMVTGLYIILLTETYGSQAKKDIMSIKGRLYNLPFSFISFQSVLNGFFVRSEYVGLKFIP